MEGIVLVRPEPGTSGLRRAPGTRPGRLAPQAQDWLPSQYIGYLQSDENIVHCFYSAFPKKRVYNNSS